MTISATYSYSDARAHLAELLDRAVDDRETVLITRRGEVVAVVLSAEEYNSLIETAHLLKSPANAQRLFAALTEVARGEDIKVDVDQLVKDKGVVRR